MALKPKINSLRCKQWFGFAKNKLNVLKSFDVPGKTYIINGYKIILKALIDLAIIEAPPGVIVLTKSPNEMRVFYADMFGEGKEKLKEIAPFNSLDTGAPLQPYDDGWPGNVLVWCTGSDFSHGYFSARIPEFTERGGIGFRAAVYASFVYKYENAYFNYIANRSWPQSCSLAILGNYYAYIWFPDVRNVDIGFNEIYLGYGKNQHRAFYILNELPIPGDASFCPSMVTWPSKFFHYACLWTTYSQAKARNIAVGCMLIQGMAPGFTQKGIAFIFFEIDPEANYAYDLRGCTLSDDIYTLYPYSELDEASDLRATYFGGQPNTQASELTSIKNVYFPLNNNELAIFQYNTNFDPGDPDAVLKLVVNDSGSPYINNALSLPYEYDSDDEEMAYKFPFCSRVVERRGIELDVYLYWTEWLRYGAEETDIIDLHYGSPYRTWIAIPALPSGTHLTSFNPIHISYDRQILHGTVFVEGINGGMFTAILDTNKAATWRLGKKFSNTRIDRCSIFPFGDHTYTEMRRNFTGTLWGWDYSYCRNYEEPEGGYP